MQTQFVTWVAGRAGRSGCAALAAVGLLLLLVLPIHALYPLSGHAWIFLPFAWLDHGTGWVAVLLLIPSLCACLGGPGAPPASDRLLVATAPWVLGALWLAPMWPPDARAQATFYPAVAWLAGAAFWATRRWMTGSAQVTRRSLAVIFAIATLFYAATGIYYTTACGPHAGDEGYYLIQVDSLWQDGDTDLANNLTHASRHISPNSRPPHQYTYHAPGLPFLLALFQPLGMVARHLVLGAIAALGLVAVLGLCRHAGVARGPSLLLVALLGFSIYWGVYSSRCLPEILGASLVACVFWAGARQAAHPYVCAVSAALCTAYLPLANIRFSPVAVGCAGLYLLLGLLDDRSWRARLRGLLVWATLLALAASLVHIYQVSRFVGGLSHSVGRMLFSNPVGAWLALAEWRGLVNTFPGFLWLLAANVIWAVREPKTRWIAVGALALFAGVLATSCMVDDWGGGSTLGGRFLVVTIAVQAPGAAWLWTRCTPAARYLLLLLAGISIALWAWQMALLPALGSNFGRPWSELAEAAPSMVGLRRVLSIPSLFPWLAAGVLLVAAWPASRPCGAAIALVVGLGALVLGQARVPAAWQQPAYADFATTPGRLADKLQVFSMDRVRATRLDDPAPRQLFDISNRFHVSPGITNVPTVVTTRSFLPSGSVIDQSALDVNDWQERPLRWATLREPFHAGRGERALRLRGRIDGGVQAHLAVREGSTTMVEEPLVPGPDGRIDHTVVVHCRGRGHVYLLLRLEGGDGAFIGEKIAWSPYHSTLFPAAGVTLDAPGVAVR